MVNVVDVLKERGFIEQTTHEDELRNYLESEEVTCYIGFDPTASSLHVGSLVPIMSLAHMQKHGHRPIALIGGGTGLVGDPSGKTEMRQLLTTEMVESNALGIKDQLSRFVDFEHDRAIMVNNADWLTKLEYIPFLRDIGRHFIEFNYMLLQAYDFLELYDHYRCRLQMGGSDQWGNIVAGVELIRRVRQKTVYGITFPLVTTSSGEKMGKTAKGAVWLDAERTSAYDYFQVWINTDDPDVERFLALFTFLPMAEIRAIEKLDGAELNSAKRVLAFEAAQLVHGREAALQAYQAAASMFGAQVVSKKIMPSSTIPREETGQDDTAVPHSFLTMGQLKTGIPAFKIFHSAGLASSGGAARRLIEQGGAYLNGQRIESFDQIISENDLNDMELLLRSGKKRYHKIIVKQQE